MSYASHVDNKVIGVAVLALYVRPRMGNAECNLKTRLCSMVADKLKLRPGTWSQYPALALHCPPNFYPYSV
jgi:hypothetical protein